MMLTRRTRTVTQFDRQAARLLVAALAILYSCGQSSLAATITIGDPVTHTISLLPNTPNQTVPISISGTDTNVVGMDFFVIVGDGGPQLAQWSIGLPAGTAAPDFANLPSDVNITGTGTIFAGVNTGAFDLFAGNGPPGPYFGSLPQAAAYETNTLTPSTHVTDNGVIAYLTFDTTGFTSGNWPIALNDTGLGGTDYTDLVLSTGSVIVPTVLGGQIKIIPEPSSILLGGLAVALAALHVGRIRRRG
ncbi:MAG TPA: hypothetical protein VG713_20635 [Pirellulales bacterium]|nr:hypothetical protein [Pirellulales bacterium]